LLNWYNARRVVDRKIGVELSHSSRETQKTTRMILFDQTAHQTSLAKTILRMMSSAKSRDPMR
jgi:hypothetical protein